MQIYLLYPEPFADDLAELERRLRGKWPGLQRCASLQTFRGLSTSGSEDADRVFLIIPILQGAARFEEMVESAALADGDGFLIFVSRDITASDYKKLVRNARADWASLTDAPAEIEEIISRNLPESASGSAPRPARKPDLMTFLPSAGGVGNTTLAIETAVHLKTSKNTRNRHICIVDLEMQTSHICDHLDIEPRLRMNEIVDEPKRLDNQLFDLFVSHHSSGVDVLATPRNRTNDAALNMDALDALFGILAAKYDTLIVDLPLAWHNWTPNIISFSDFVVVTGLNTVPGLRQVVSTLEAVKALGAAGKTVVALNRCETGFLGRIARSAHIKKILGGEQVLIVRSDARSAADSTSTGIPVVAGQPSSRISRDTLALAELVSKNPVSIAGRVTKGGQITGT